MQKKKNKQTNVLISSAGRRVALLKLFQEEIRKNGGNVFATDAGLTSPACRYATDWQQVPRCDHKDFCNSVMEVCKKWDISLIVPTIDTEIPVFTKHREIFEAENITLCLSGVETTKICSNKFSTTSFLKQIGIPTPLVLNESISEDCFLEKVNSQNQFPLIIKPAEGSSSIGVQEVIDLEELQFFYKRTRDPIVQAKAVGDEYTVNFYVDRNKACRVAVPHRRLETRAGEVSKCITCHIPELERFAALLASKLPDAFGPMCYQAFCSDDGRIEVIEINARFGGGYPVAHFAGANFIKCLLQEMHHEGLSDEALNWTPGTAMLRWDDAVFTTAEDIFAN